MYFAIVPPVWYLFLYLFITILFFVLCLVWIVYSRLFLRLSLRFTSNYVYKCMLKREAILKISNMFNTVNAYSFKHQFPSTYTCGHFQDCWHIQLISSTWKSRIYYLCTQLTFIVIWNKHDPTFLEKQYNRISETVINRFTDHFYIPEVILKEQWDSVLRFRRRD